MTIVVKNTNISDLLEVSNGNMDVMKKMTKEFRQLVQGQKSVSGSRVESTRETKSSNNT